MFVRILAPLAEMEQWRVQTRGDFEAVAMPGGDFFLHAELPAVAEVVRRTLCLLQQDRVCCHQGQQPTG